MSPIVKNRLIRIALLSVVALLLAAGIVWWQADRGRAERAAAGRNTFAAVAVASIGGPFTLVDQTGRTVTDRDFAGSFLLVYFGYTFCPDVCPTELATMAQALEQLGGDAQRVQPVFITVDPQRDTPQQLAGYVRLFGPRLVGLTGTPEQIAAAERAYRVYAARAPADNPDGYTMDHSSFVYLMGPDGRNRDVFPHNTPPDEMAARIRAQLHG